MSLRNRLHFGMNVSCTSQITYTKHAPVPLPAICWDPTCTAPSKRKPARSEIPKCNKRSMTCKAIAYTPAKQGTKPTPLTPQMEKRQRPSQVPWVLFFGFAPWHRAVLRQLLGRVSARFSKKKSHANSQPPEKNIKNK